MYARASWPNSWMDPRLYLRARDLLLLSSSPATLLPRFRRFWMRHGAGTQLSSRAKCHSGQRCCPPMIHPFFRQRQYLGSDFDQAFPTMHCTRMSDEVCARSSCQFSDGVLLTPQLSHQWKRLVLRSDKTCSFSCLFRDHGPWWVNNTRNLLSNMGLTL